MRSATVGQFLVNETLPEELRDYERVLDKRGLTDLLREVAQKHPDRYKEISFALNEVGREGAQESGSFSFGLRHLKTSKAAGKTRKRIQDRLTKILSRADLDDTKMGAWRR